jgi:hypothetical protein
VVCNHPTGIADGVAVYDVLKAVRPDLCFYANSDAHRVSPRLGEVLTLQSEGDKSAAEAFITKFTSWDDNLHGAIAARIREHQRYRYRLFAYAALGE